MLALFPTPSLAVTLPYILLLKRAPLAPLNYYDYYGYGTLSRAPIQWNPFACVLCVGDSGTREEGKGVNIPTLVPYTSIQVLPPVPRE